MGKEQPKMEVEVEVGRAVEKMMMMGEWMMEQMGTVR